MTMVICRALELPYYGSMLYMGQGCSREERWEEGWRAWRRTEGRCAAAPDPRVGPVASPDNQNRCSRRGTATFIAAVHPAMLLKCSNAGMRQAS